MNFAVEVIVATDPNVPANLASPAQRLPSLHDTIQDACTAGSAFLRVNGRYMASKSPNASAVLFQVVDGGGDIVVSPRDR